MGVQATGACTVGAVIGLTRDRLMPSLDGTFPTESKYLFPVCICVEVYCGMPILHVAHNGFGNR